MVKVTRLLMVTLAWYVLDTCTHPPVEFWRTIKERGNSVLFEIGGITNRTIVRLATIAVSLRIPP
jgi:hypothetical protein